MTQTEQTLLLEIVHYPDPFLTRRCRAITAEEFKAGKVTLTAKEAAPGQALEWTLTDLVDRMMATMYASQGIGLAAPQVGIGLRLFVMDISKDHSGAQAIFNPILTDKRGTVVEEEGCLSLPDIRAKVKRFLRVHINGVNVRGEPFDAEAAELPARVCQHEIDHLDGVLFINKLGMTSKLMIRKQLIELEEDFELKNRKNPKL
ncbi:MAG TPA: peptide deformylase [Planctomycetota bacterium]|jgi:peptide deformylase